MFFKKKYPFITIQSFLIYVFQYLTFFYISDIILCKLFTNKARWFQLHALINFIVVYNTHNDVYQFFIDPVNTLTNYCERKTGIMIISLHMYHIIMFQKLSIIDYIHHILSTFLMGGLGTFFYFNSTLNIINFYICGLPGGIDYILLCLVKHGKINKLTEKKYNSYLNNYIRNPGMLTTLTISSLNLYYDNLDIFTPKIIQIITIFMTFLNATYFNHLACFNYGVHFS